MNIDQKAIAPGDPERIAYVQEIITARRGGLAGVPVLDLACRTGQFTTALAKAGARAVGVEGRAENIAMARKTKGARFVQADVRDLSAQAHGTHDVVLCLGILYHLDAVDALGLLRAIRSVTSEGGFAILDTHVSAGGNTTVVDGTSYEGIWWTEPAEARTRWSAIGNLASWWFSPESLRRACADAGWSEFEALEGVRYEGESAGRMWAVLS